MDLFTELAGLLAGMPAVLKIVGIARNYRRRVTAFTKRFTPSLPSNRIFSRFGVFPRSDFLVNQR